MPLFIFKEKEREYGIYERKTNVGDIYCSCSGYRCRITPQKDAQFAETYIKLLEQFLNPLNSLLFLSCHSPSCAGTASCDIKVTIKNSRLLYACYCFCHYNRIVGGTSFASGHVIAPCYSCW